MLSTEMALICSGLVAFLGLGSGIIGWRIARQARSYTAECADWAQKAYKLREPTAQIAELSAEMTELADSYHALLKSHKKLRSRFTMRENREKGGNGEPSDLSSETDKRQLRLAAKSAGLLK